MLQKGQRTGQGRGMLGASLPTFGGTESMTLALQNDRVGN